MNHRLAVGATSLLFLAVMAPQPAAAAAVRQAQGPACEIVADKVASPARLVLGDQVQIRLTVTPKCPPAAFRAADIVLAVDRSRSMLTGGKLVAAKAAARTFVQVTDLSVHQVAVVGFHGTASLEQSLTQDSSLLISAINGLNIDIGTNIAAAIDVAASELARNGRPDTLSVIILITDGAPNRPKSDPQGAAVRSANGAKLAGVEIFAIGLGNDVDEDLLKALVSSESNYFYAPDNSELEIVYRTIALLVGDFVLRDLELDDTLTPEVDLVPGSDNPPANVQGATLHWSQGLVPGAGLSWVYTITPTVAGTYPTNVRARATYRTADGFAGQVDFPVPTITVLEPTPPEPECTLTTSWTIMVHSFPDSTGVSGAARPGCNNRFDSGDWFNGGAFTLPALEYELADGTGANVLFQGTGVPSAGRVDQWLYIRVCTPPPYRLRLLTGDLDGYEPCVNSPTVREITLRDFRPRVFQRTEERFGFVR